MSATECRNAFNIPNHKIKLNYPLKKVTATIQAQASALGFHLLIGDAICDKCRLYARSKVYRDSITRSLYAKGLRKSQDNTVFTITTISEPEPSTSYIMQTYDSSNHNDSSNDPYSPKFNHQQALQNVDEIDNKYGAGENYLDEYSLTPKVETISSNPSTTNENSNSLLNITAPNPISEFKIIAVTSLPAEKHNEIMNNDDNAMHAMDSIYNHQSKINEIISTTSNANVFGIAKKPDNFIDDSNSLLIPSTSKSYQQVPYKKKRNTKIKRMRQKMQMNYRSSAIPMQNTDEAGSSTVVIEKDSSDSDEHSNSKFNRRKNILQPLDCKIEFDEFNKTQKKQGYHTEKPLTLDAELESVKLIKNPNANLIRKVAFLRVCVNYMMNELEGKTFNFGKVITYENLKAKYNKTRH